MSAAMLWKDFIFGMKRASDRNKDQRDLFQLVPFFSLISHIEPNEQLVVENVFGINHGHDLTALQPSHY